MATKYTKPYSYELTVQDPDGRVIVANHENYQGGRKKSTYSTEDKARETLMKNMVANIGIGRKVISWELTCYGKVIKREEIGH